MAHHKHLMKEWQALFRKADKDNSGTLDAKELRNLLKHGNSKVSKKQIDETFQFFDGTKGDRQITLEEFTKGMQHLFDFAQQVEEWFRELDADGSGYLEKDEIRGIFSKSGKTMTDGEIKEMLKKADSSGDGKISLQELLEAWVGKPIRALQVT